MAAEVVPLGEGSTAFRHPDGGLTEPLGADARHARKGLKFDWRPWLFRTIWLAWAVLLAAHLATMGHIPAGLHYDEAFEALDALRIGRNGFWPVFLPGNFGREPLLAYVMALSLRIFGNNVWAVRFPAAVAWGASLPALYWLIGELYPFDRGTRMVRWLIAAPLLMTSLWFAITAQYAIRVNWLVLMELLFLAALWRTWNSGRVRDAALAGVLGGLCLYTYLPSRLLPLLLGIMLIMGLVWRRTQVLARQRVLAIVVAVGILVSLPLVVHFARFPEDSVLRLSQVAVAPTDQRSSAASWLAALLDNTKRVVGMFFLHGDGNPRNNLPGRPALTWWSLPLFLIGLVTIIGQPRRFRGVFVLLWLLVMLLPTWLSQSAPSFQRAVGAVPPLVLLMAAGGTALWQSAQGIESRTGNRIMQSLRGKRSRAAVATLLVATVLVEGALSLHAFQQWASMPQLFYAFDEGILQVGQYIAHLPQQQRVFLTPLQDHATLTYSLTTVPEHPEVLSFDGRRVLVARPGEDSIYVVITHEDFRFEVMAPWLYAGQPLQPEKTFYDREGQAYAKVFHVPAIAQLRTPAFSADLRWADGVHLMGYDPIGCCTYEPGDRIYLELWWAPTTQPPEETWTVFTHLLAPDGRLVAQDDSEPGGGSYPTTLWRPGDVIVDEHQFSIPADTPPGQYTLEIGLYNWQTGQRLGLTDAPGDSVSLKTITVEASP